MSHIIIYQGDFDESSLGDTSEMTEDQVKESFDKIHKIERRIVRERFGREHKIEFDQHGDHAPGSTGRVSILDEPNGNDLEVEIENALGDAFQEWLG